jgi:hypothetical protein
LDERGPEVVEMHSRIRKTVALVGVMTVMSISAMALIAPGAGAAFRGGGCPDGYRMDKTGTCVAK